MTTTALPDNAMPPVTRRSRWRWLFRSLATRLIGLMLISIVVPVLVYRQFEAVDLQRQNLLLQIAQEEGRLIAGALLPVLEKADGAALAGLSAPLARFADSHTGLKLLVRPRNLPGNQGFYYVAAAPAIPDANMDLERRRLLDEGVFDRLGPQCSNEQSLAIRLPAEKGDDEILTSITPLATDFGCWAVVTSHSAKALMGESYGRPYWETPEVEAAALVYFALVLSVLALFLDVWRNLRRFGALARRICEREHRLAGSFQEHNTVPELGGVAEDFDRLVATLNHSAESLRRAAEDNAHALKTPIAVIRQSIEPLKRTVGGAPESRAHRAIDMIERSVDRLDGLVSFARTLDRASADLLERAPGQRIALSGLLDRVLDGYGHLMTERQLTLHRQIAPAVTVRGGEEMLETVIENIMDNAISLTAAGRRIVVTLARAGTSAELTIDDEGPGVDAAALPLLFERYYSQRPESPAEGGTEGSGDGPHFGIGLWIVRRNVEAMGGTVAAENRPAGGLRMRIVLPLAARSDH
ncbi:MAG: HAMP domain-containing sensor histidine kinase [Azospirillaceae bacterium]|nr:HAMP domain-containing sensor histidine kinase [Azospirillaceae bacterium]